MNKLILVSTCTNNKTARVSESLKLQNCKSSIFEKAVSSWTNSLWQSSDKRVPARELYSGNHWGETLKAYANLQACEQVEPSLWVLSAGCGLVPADLPLPPYSATFSSGTDGINELIWQPGWSAKERSQYWWQGLNAGKPADLPRTLLDVDPDPQTTWLFVLSKEYMPAVEQELFELISAGRQVLICSWFLHQPKVSSPCFTISLICTVRKIRELPASSARFQSRPQCKLYPLVNR